MTDYMNVLDDKVWRVAIYLRKSRADENNPYETLERHKEILLNYAKENNLIVVDIFEEIISGGMLYNRTEMLKLLDNVPKHIYDAVLCIDLDRLGRGSAADSEKIFDVLKENDTKIITLKKVYDLNNEYDEDYSEFEMFMARKELKFISRRMNRGRIKSINEGCFVSGAPFGYRNVVINHKSTLEIYEPEAQYVRMVFDLYANKGLGFTAISRHLQQLGVLTKKGTPISRSTIGRMIKNYAYIGKIVWNKSKCVKGQNAQVPTDKSTWVFVDGLHEPIIDEELFYRAQKILDGRYKPPVNHGILKNPLAGILKCGICGKTMIAGKPRRPQGSYRIYCSTLTCNRASPLQIIEDNVFSEIKKELESMESIISDTKTANHDREKDTYNKSITKAKNEIDKLQLQHSNLYDLLEQKVYSADVFMERSQNIKNRIEVLNKQIEDATTYLSSLDNTSIIKKIPIFRDVITRYYDCDAQQRNILLKHIISRIEYIRNDSASADDIDLKVHFR